VHSSRARVTWYSAGDCSASALGAVQAAASGGSAGIRTIVILRQAQCQRVPDSDLGYMVFCGASRSAAIAYCNSDCSYCPHSAAVASPGACTPNAPGYGASAFSTSCLAADVTVSSVHALPGDAYIRWIAAADCADEIDGATHMLVPQRVCHFVPAAPGSTPEGYRVTCASDGSTGLFEVCDRSCASCSVHMPFANQGGPDGTSACISSPTAAGSRSVRFECVPPFVNVSSSAEAPSGTGRLAMLVTVES
jgi:hypothetical protein